MGRYREARTLLQWLGADLRGLRVLDVAGGDGYSRDELAGLLAASGFDVLAHQYQFRTRWAQQLYLGLSHGGKAGFNAAAPLMPLVAAADRGARGDGGAIVLVRARRRGGPAAGPGGSAHR